MTWLERSRPLKRSKPMARSRIKRGGLPRRVTRPGPGSDPAYLAEVRKLPCRVLRVWATNGVRLCEGDTVAHHAGAKTNDSTAVPLCVKHHRQWHDLNGVFKGWEKPQLRTWAADAIADIRAIVAITRARVGAEHTAATTGAAK